MAIKLDMAKAYDRVEWEFLRSIMCRMGFRESWVNMVMQCVTTASFFFMINGNPEGRVVPTRGLRQGDPISPYLFLFVTEGLIGLLKRAEVAGTLRGHKISSYAPSVSHLLFADDSILFCAASEQEAATVRGILAEYEQASGQQVNLAKSCVQFAKGVTIDRRNNVLLTLDIREVLAQEKYLGLPTYVGQSRNKALRPVRDRIGKRLSGWMDRLFSWSGREVLIKAVAQAIPTYAMSVFKFPKDLCASIQGLINRFWWSHDPDKKKMHWISAEKLCEKKENGGLGFRDFEAFNDAMLAKQVWRLMHTPESLLYRLLQARYFPGEELLTAGLGNRPSFTWRSLHGVFDLVRKGCRWLVGNGASINVWYSSWIPRPHSFLPIRPPDGINPNAKILC